MIARALEYSTTTTSFVVAISKEYGMVPWILIILEWLLRYLVPGTWYPVPGNSLITKYW